jgi:hypothetical protein
MSSNVGGYWNPVEEKLIKPMLAEIHTRMEKLLRWCDTLEAQWHQTRTLGAHLLASTHHHLLAA